MRDRFPGIVDGVARFDGPAGTLMVDSAIDAMREELSANLGGSFVASDIVGSMVDGARSAVGALFGAPADSVVFGANMTTMTFAFSRAVTQALGPGDEIVCTRLDHDANVTPWVLAARDCGADVVFAPVEDDGRLTVEAIGSVLTPRTRWVAVTGASNLLGWTTDLPSIVDVVHRAGARVYVDAVHLAPHRRIDFSALGADALVCSPYKWYGPHAGVLLLTDELQHDVQPYKVRPAPDSGPRRFETGTPAFESIAGVAAAARFMLEGRDDEDAVFATLLEGLHSIGGVTIVGPQGLEDRTPTVLFNVRGHDPHEVAAHLGAHDVAVWAGHSYAVEPAAVVGTGVRAGVVRYVNEADVHHLLEVLATVAR